MQFRKGGQEVNRREQSKLHQEKSLTGLAGSVYFLTKTIEIYNKVAMLQLWVFVPESERFTKVFLEGSSGFILMYDITNTETLNYLSEWCQLIKNHLDYDPSILLVGNKVDLEEKREVSKEEVEKFKEKHDISSSMEISLKTGENTFNMFKKLSEMVYMEWKESLNQKNSEEWENNV